MSTLELEVQRLSILDSSELWEELGRVVRSENLGMLPEEEEKATSEKDVGRWYFARQLPNIKKIYCCDEVSGIVKDKQRHEVATFVTTFIDIFAAYFGIVAGTIILVQIHKIGVDKFCAEA